MRQGREQIGFERNLLAPRTSQILLHRLLLHHLHGVMHSAVTLDHLDHLTKATLAQHAQDLEVLQLGDNAFLDLELKDVLVMRRPEERLECVLLEEGEDAVLRVAEDATARSVRDLTFAQLLDRLREQIPRILVEESQVLIRGGVVHKGARQFLGGRTQGIEAGQRAEALACREEVEGIHRELWREIGALLCWVLVQLTAQILAEDAAVSGIGEHIRQGDAQAVHRRHLRPLRLRGGLRELVEPVGLVGGDEAEKTARELGLVHEELLEEGAFEADKCCVLVRCNRGSRHA
mmetsp:Transcript_23847/g.50574  ORF Transcript_23847/g.50574 Transcript_23847/m.50574 type:complete len:291 (+) Transcript_23847:1401-2273(+)